MTRPRISIVTLSFNQARYLGDAIASIQGQGYPNLEHIIVDPGSTDGSRDVIAARCGGVGSGVESAVGGGGARVLLDPDKGPADGLNKGFAAATGEIFGYINADDLLLPGALDAVARQFTARPQVDAILGNGLLIDADGQPRRRIDTSRYSLADFGHGAMTFVQQGHFFRARAFAAAGGFNIANRTCWDAELLIDMGLAGMRFANVPERLGAFRLYGETITGSGRLAEQTRIDFARLQARALGRPPAARDRLLGPLHVLARRVAGAGATLEGVRARFARPIID